MRAGVTLADTIRELPAQRRDEIFLALLNKAMVIRPRAADVQSLFLALGNVEGPTFMATFGGNVSNDLFIERCQRLNVPPEKIARFLLLA